MPFVERGQDGKIKGLYAVKQVDLHGNRNPGVGDTSEILPDNDPEVVAFLAPPLPRAKPKDDPALAPVVGNPPVTRAEFEALKAALLLYIR